MASNAPRPMPRPAPGVVFQALNVADLPSEWQIEPSQQWVEQQCARLGFSAREAIVEVCVELPDNVLSSAYQEAICATGSKDKIAVIITPEDQWLERRALAHAILRDLYLLGVPTPPNQQFVRVVARSHIGA